MKSEYKSRVFSILLGTFLVLVAGTIQSMPQNGGKYFTISIVDNETERGVPLVELKTPSRQRFYTDSHGLIALDEPTLMNQTVSFTISSHGYKRTEDVILTPTPGGKSLIKIKRLNVAERLYRITGQDIYDASARVGHPIPIKQQRLNGGVTGQDTFIETLYDGKLYWFWGDTFGPFQFNGKASGATSDLPGKGGLDPSIGVDLNYFVDSTGFSKPMCPFGGPTLVWIQWLATATDDKGNKRLYARYKCIKKDTKPGEAGFAVFNDSAQTFEPFKILDEWYGLDHRIGHPTSVRIDGQDFLYIINYDGLERVKADVAQFTNPSMYEHFTCFSSGTKHDRAKFILDRDASGKLVYDWKSDAAALNHRRQADLVHDGKIKPDEGLWHFEDVESGRRVSVDPASVCWNAFRKRWVMLAYEFTGGVWYFEGDTPTGPWVYGRKIVAHEHYDFYNVGQHPVFDQDGGRLIYFEGTYTTGFSGNKFETPLYDYNQMMYRLALDDKRLTLPAPVYHLKDKLGKDQYLMRESVDSLNLWDDVVGIPFFAIHPNRQDQRFMPVFSQSSGDRIRLTTEAQPSPHSASLFYALPSVSSKTSQMDPITGTWKCKADFPGSDFEMELQKNGEIVTGTYVTRGTFSNGKLDLALQILDYTLEGRLEGNALVGEFKKLDGAMSGTWSGDRSPDPSEKESPSVVFLYEYATSDNKYVYSVDSTLATATFRRTAKPICRVWRNPSSVVALDYKAKPNSTN